MSSAMVASMLAMEPFLPSGTREHDVRLPKHSISSDSSSSVISPLALPRGVVGYFDSLSVLSHPNPIATQPSIKTSGTIGKPHVYSPLSPSFRGPPQPQPAHFLSPQLAPTTQQSQYELQQRSSSLSPTRLDAAMAAIRSDLGMMAFPTSTKATDATGSTSGSSAAHTSYTSSGRSGSYSADTASSVSQAHTVQRLVQQNGRIRCAWEAERKYLEANRERAEEVYKEERALMEEERAAWDMERATLLVQIEQLQQQVLVLRGGDRALAGKNGVTSRQPVYSDGAQEVALSASMRSFGLSTKDAQPGQGNGVRVGGELVSLEAMSAPGTFRRSAAAVAPPQTEFWPAGQARSSALSKPPGPSSFIPLTSNYIATSAPFAPDPMASADSEDSGPIPIVDIQEIHPELEGIPIKATTIHKATFTDAPSSSGSRASSGSKLVSPPEANHKSAMPKRVSAEQTLQVLQADESRRLVMHAGHTPSHSISLLATSVTSAISTSSCSGERTPQGQANNAAGHAVDAPAPDEKGKAPIRHARIAAPDTDEISGTSERKQDLSSMDHPEPHLEPTEDRGLKGPLMVRNMPAHDEIFFRRLSDKLEEVTKDPEGILPAVLRDAVQDGESSRDDAILSDMDGANDACDDAESNPKSNDEELEVALKFKKSNNFGAPFGEC